MQNAKHNNSISYTGEAPDGLIELMQGKQEAYFEANIVDGMLSVDEEVPKPVFAF